MSGPWLLLALTLILTLTGVPGGCSQPEEGPQEEAVENALSLADLQEDLQQVLGDLGGGGGASESVIPLPNWIYKRQHPGNREKAEKGGQAVVDLEPPKPEDPVRWDHEASLVPDFAEELKRPHPGRRTPWMRYLAIKRQHPGWRLVDPSFQSSWEEEEEGEGTLMPEKRRHPGKRAPGGPCGPQEACGQVGHPFGFLDDLSRAQEKPWPRQVPWVREPLEV